MMKYYLEFTEIKSDVKIEHIWLVDIDKEPHYEDNSVNYKFLKTVHQPNDKVDKIIIKFIENLNEKNIFRREVLFEKTRMTRRLKVDSEFIITLVRVHLFMGSRNKLIKGTGPFSNPIFRLHKTSDDGTVVATWILNDVTIIESSFYLDQTITSIEKESIAIEPSSYWVLN